ncbi:GNAT family N-acetyltransferase [Micromonospora sp. NPDC126480]|uniref:GNAT family N-acetyltransferase n=1 Tax=Micromonospora sp. NPDC126480 TaxID=3155312 RepID=UPI0033342F5B
MELTAFEAAHAPVVAGWAGSAEESRRWCSRDDVTPDVVAGWAAAPDVIAYVAVEHGEPVAYGELWVDDDEAEVELARLIVAPAQRGRGFGRDLVTRLTAAGLAYHPAVFMRVHPDNVPALRCYAGAGFVPVPAEQAAQWNEGQPVAYVWLSHPGGA